MHRRVTEECLSPQEHSAIRDMLRSGENCRNTLAGIALEKIMPRMQGELSQAEAAARLRVAPSTMYKFERDGLITPRRENPDARHSRLWYRWEDVEHVRKTWKRKRTPTERQRQTRDERERKLNARGEWAGPAFRVFLAGGDWKKAVAELSIDPVMARELYAEFSDPEGVEQRRLAEAKKLREERDERRRDREHARKRRLEQLQVHQVRLVQEAKRGSHAGVNIVLPPEPGKPKG